MDLKFSSALIAPMDEEDDDDTMSCGSNQGGYDRESKLVSGEIPKIDRLTQREKKVLTKRLMKPEIEFREHMREIVKDFPTMKTEIGGGEFEKKIQDQLFHKTDNNFRQSIESFEGNEEIMG